MSARIESLPIPEARPGNKGSWMVAAALALFVAAGAAAYVAIQHDGPASGSAAVSSQSGSIAGRGRALARQAALSESAASFPSVAALERQAAYGSAALTRPGLGLAELRGVDVVGIGTAGLWSKFGAITSNFPSVAALERQAAQAAALPPTVDCLLIRHGPC
jgi:hypothetical protein